MAVDRNSTQFPLHLPVELLNRVRDHKDKVVEETLEPTSVSGLVRKWIKEGLKRDG